MNILVLDTETISINKPFCYNAGYIIGNEDGEILLRRDFVIKEIWYNKPLFETAYYFEKRPIYVNSMRGKKARLVSWREFVRNLSRDIEDFEVSCGYAYNSPFDNEVLNFNSNWFQTNNPLELLPLKDIRGNVHQFFALTTDFQNFCEETKEFTEAGNYSTTAETVYRYITQNYDFEEAHTALADSLIEYQILLATIRAGAKIEEDYETYRSIVRTTERELKIKLNGKDTSSYSYNTKSVRGDTIYLKTN